MRYQERRCAAGYVLEPLEEGSFRANVQRRRWLVENQDRCPVLQGEQRPRDRDSLPLPAGQLRTALVLAGEGSLETGRQAVECREDPGTASRRPQTIAVAGYLHGSKTHVLGRRELVPVEVLKDDPDLTAPVVHGEVADVRGIGQDTAPGRLVQPCQQLDQRGLACTI